MSELQLVSVVIPCRNEQQYIAKCLDSIIGNDYPKDKLEILVVDGMSEDGTRAIVAEYAQHFAFITLLDNPKKIFPAAVNIGFRKAKGGLIAIMGAHATYAVDYLSQCVRYQAEFQADNVGGVLITAPRDSTLFGNGIALALSHPFGAGNAKFRTGSVGQMQSLWVDTVFGGCYRREVFQLIGNFNESLIRSSDIDFNIRLRKAGGRVLLALDIVAYYYATSSLRRFWANNFIDGEWTVYPLKFGSRIFSWRHLMPLAFVSGLIGSATLLVILPVFAWLFLAMLAAYGTVNTVASVLVARNERSLKYALIMPIVFGTRHIAYGLGSLWALTKVLLSRKFWFHRNDRTGNGR